MDCCQNKRPFHKKSISVFLGMGNCHGEVNQSTHGLEKIVLIGSSNVGKSVLFNVIIKEKD